MNGVQVVAGSNPVAPTNTEMEPEKIIAELERSPGEKVIVRHRVYKGKAYLDIRQFFEGDEGQWLPTKKGVSLPWEQKDELLRALESAQDEEG